MDDEWRCHTMASPALREARCHEALFANQPEEGTPGLTDEELVSAHLQGRPGAFNRLYVCVNGGGVGGHGSGLYYLHDTNGDDQLDNVTPLRGLQGGGEHGPHAVVLTPDGKSLMVVGGNHTKPPNPETYSVPKNYAEDLLLPRMADARGHARNIRAPGGWIAKTDPDGKAWNFYSSGFRNQYDVAFNATGRAGYMRRKEDGENAS